MKISAYFLLYSLFVLPFCPSVAKAQEVVRYEPVALSFWTADNLSISLSRQGDGYLLTLQLRATNRRFLPESTLWLRTFDDQMIQLSGKLIDNEVLGCGVDERVWDDDPQQSPGSAIVPDVYLHEWFVLGRVCDRTAEDALGIVERSGAVEGDWHLTLCNQTPRDG